MKSKKLQKYQNSGPVSQSKDSGIITFESNPEYFNNRTFEKWQIKLLSSGEFGVDPKTNAIHKLKKPVSVPQEWLDVTSGNYEGSGTQRRFQAEAGLNQAYQNPLMYAPGSIGLGAYLTPAIRAGIPGAMEMLNAPLQIGSKTINPVTIANLATAAGAAQAPENIVSGVQNIIKGNYTEGAAGIGMAALDLIGPESISAAKPIGNYLRNLGNPAAGLDPLKYFKKQPIPGTNLYGRDSRSPFEEMLYNFYSKKSGGNKNGSNKKWSTIEPGDPINDATPPPKQEEVYETPTNIPLDYFSRRNKSIDISGTSALDILDSQAVKELKKSGESLNNFVNRVKTPEGRRRAKELGIDDVDSFVGRVSIHPFYDKPSYQTLGLFESKPIHAVSLGGDKFNPYEIRHELQHAIDTESNPLNTFGGLFMDDVPTSKIAEDLGKLKLKPSSGRKYKEDISHFSKDTEKPAFLSEIQEYLMQNNIVKNAYDRITPEDVMAGYKHSVDTKSNNGRLFKLIDETDYDNFKIISNNLNKMLSATPLVGLGAISSQQNEEQDTQKYQSGGAIMKTQKKKGLQKYQNGNEVDYIPSLANIFSQGLGLSPNISNPGGNPFGNIPFGDQITSGVFNAGKSLLDSGITSPKNLNYEDFLKQYGYNDDFLSKTKYQAYKMSEGVVNTKNQDALVKNLPLAANMFAIDELNKLTEKSYNQGLKLDAQDLTKGTKGQEFRGFFAKDGMRVGNFQNSGGVYPNFNQRVSQAQQDNSRLTNLNPTDKLSYFGVLAGYVKQNGLEALKAHPVEFEFFTRTAEEVKAASVDPAQKEPPVDGGTYVEAEIKDKRQQEDKEETTTPKKTKRPDFSSKVGVTNAAQSFDAMLEYLAASSQDTQMSKDDYYNVLMQVEEDKRRQNPDSNIYTSARKPYSPSTSGQSELIRSLGRGSVNAFQSGGQINQLQQMLGYKDGSPFANLPFQTINSNSITMDGVSQPLLAIADNGERRVMQPNSGLHKFAGAKSVIEVPMAQNGGSLNLHKLGIFQSGGNTNNLTKLDTDKGAPYEYYYDNTTEDYYIKTPSGQLTKTEKGSDTYNKMANTYGTTVHKKETQQKPLNGKIIRDESDPYDYFYDEETKRYAFRKRGETDLWRIVDPNSSRGAAIKKVVDEAVEYNNGLKGAKEPKGFIENYLIDPIKDIFGFQNGGVLQYQLGGNPKPLYVNPSNPNSINQVYGQEKQGMTEAERSAREFHENEMDSPGYFKKVRDMLPASIPEFKRDYEAANVIKARKAALREARNTGATIPSTSGAAGQYNSNKGTVSFQGKSSEQHPHQEVGTNVHELSHASTRGGDFQLQDEANYMKNRAKGTDPYYTNPEEIKARMDVLKAYAVSLGWVKPGENISKKHLELIGLKSKLGDGTDGAANAYKELIEKAGLTDDDLVDIWKNIASAPSNTSDVSTMARNGGRLNIFQQGGIPMQQMTPEELIRSYVDRGMTWDQPKLTPEELIRSYVDKNRTSGSISESAKRDNVLRDFLKSYENPNIDWSPQEMTPEELVRSYVNKNKTTGSISGSAKRDNTLRDFLKSYENPNINWDSTEMTPDELIRSMIQRGVVNKKQGGRITSPINLSKNINPFRLSPINSFGLGGFIREGFPSRPKSEVGFSRQPISGATTKGPMGPKATDIPSYNGGVRKLMDMPDNEYISTENLIPIQTEKGEMIVMPTGDLVKVMATKRHHQMDEDEVTDVAPEGAYILSSFGKVRINKDEAEQIITETGVKPYRIGGIQDSPTEKNLASMMTKKSMSPADIAKRVDRFFPVNSTSNPFELAANNENKTHRVPYLEGLIQLSELDKLRKGIDSGMESQQQENEDEMTEAFKNGGSTWGGVPMRNMLIPKFQSSGGVPLKDPWSTALEVGTGLFQVGADLWNSYQQRKAQKEFVKKGTLLSDQAYGKARNEMGMGYLAGMLGVMNQDPTVTAKYNDPTYLRQMQTRTPMSTLEAISNRSYANMPNYMQNAPTWQAGLGAQQAAYAAALKGANDARLTIGEQDRNAQNDWLKLMQTNLELNNNNRVEAVNATRLNRNQQVGALGNQTQGYMDSLANATLGQLSNQLSLEGVRANANVNFSNNIANSIKGGVQTIGTAGISYLDSRNKTTPTYNSGAGYGSGVGPGYGGTTPSTPAFTCINGAEYAVGLDGTLTPTGRSGKC